MAPFPFGHAALTYRELFEILRQRYQCRVYPLIRPGEAQDADGGPACGVMICEREVEGEEIQRTVPYWDDDELVMPTTVRSIYAGLKIEDDTPY